MKNLNQINDRITHLKIRNLDGIDTSKEVKLLESIRFRQTESEVFNMGLEFYKQQRFGEAMVCAWVLEDEK